MIYRSCAYVWDIKVPNDDSWRYYTNICIIYIYICVCVYVCYRGKFNVATEISRDFATNQALNTTKFCCSFREESKNGIVCA